MKTNQWIKDVKTVIGCETPQLFKVLAKIADEDSDRGLFARECQSKVFECIKDVKYFLGEIRRDAQDFTLHDITHCINVIDFMGQMLVAVDKLNPAEISFFIYSALLHDIGMVKLPEEEISLNDLREDHGDRSAQFIQDRVLKNSDDTQFHFGDYDYVYMEYLPIICASHMHEFSFIEKLPESFILDGMEIDMTLCAILLRLADAMDLKRNRAPYQLYQFLVNRTVSPDHWKKHMSISNCQVNENGIYRVDGICHDEAAHRCMYNHLDTIESEIEKVFKWKIGQHPRLRLSSHIVERNIKTDNYTMWHHSFTMDVLKITNLFMGEQLYGDKKLGLREIIQNSIDACMVRDEMNKKLGAKQDYTYKPEIYIIFDNENNQVIIRDNGTGMNEYIIEHYFLNIGASYYSSRDFKKENLEYSPSGYFGIGFLACFMLSDDVYVRTAHWEENVEYEFHFIKSDRFVTKIERPKTFSGTEIRLNLKQFIQAFDNLEDIEKYNIKNIRIEERTLVYLYETFWNLEFNKIDNTIILCSISLVDFVTATHERGIYEGNYQVNLSEYLKDIEGSMILGCNELYNNMMYLADLQDQYPLNAIKKGWLNISDKIKDCFPFIKHLYSIKDNSIYEIKDDELSCFNTFFFFPTKKINLDLGEEGDKSFFILEKSEVARYFNWCDWNCICLYKDNLYKYVKKSWDMSFQLIVEGDYCKIINDSLGYNPSCLIKVEGMNSKRFSSITYINNNNNQIINCEDYKGKIWLKHARINIHFYNIEDINFSFFRIESIIMRLSNSIIKTDTSRRFIISSSTDKLVQAICLCIYLWLYDQIKNDKDAIVSAEFLKQLILDEWDESVEGLLRPEKKPDRILYTNNKFNLADENERVVNINKDSHVVSCIDILGYKEVLRRNNKEEIEQIASDFFYFVETNALSESGFPSFQHVSYTDNFLFYYKLDYNSNNRKRHDFIKASFGEDIKSTKERIERVIYLHIFNLALSQFDLAANNIFIRGGLTIGDFNADGNIISGSALIDAHDLEEKAVYPRIILNQSVVKEFITFSRPIPLLYDKTDDVIFIDFLSAKMREDLDLIYIDNILTREIDDKKFELFKSELTEVRDNILNGIKTNTNDRVIQKYEWLIKYFDFFCCSHKDLGLNELIIENNKDVNECMKGFNTIINENQ